MPRYVAFLRGISPMNATMDGLRAAFEAAGFAEVRTVLGTGNVVFTDRRRSTAALAKVAEAGLAAELGRSFDTIVRPVAALARLLADDPYAGFAIPAQAKRVVTFLRELPDDPPALPIVRDGVHIVAMTGGEVFSAYEPHPKGPVFMQLLERTFGKAITTRTLATVEKCLRA